MKKKIHNSYKRYKLRSMFIITSVCAVIGIIYEPLSSGKLTISGPLVGFAIGVPLALFEVLFPMKFMRRWPFAATVITKAFIYLSLIWFIFMSSTFIYGFFHGLTLQDFYEEVWSRDTFNKVSIASLAFFGIIFFRQLNQLLGPGTLMRYFFGSYHRPRQEERIFMFLDIKDSTAIAEKLYINSYYAFLNDFFHDIAGPILAAKAEIYQYVGDEVVLTWPMKTGVNEANCIRVFYEIDAVISRREPYYMAHYGLIPQYKAGVHGGEVIRAEIGDLKRDLIFNGDVLNTTARIQAECNRFNARLLISSFLLKNIILPEEIQSENLGRIMLKGKRQPIELVRLYKKSELPYDSNTARINSQQEMN